MNVNQIKIVLKERVNDGYVSFGDVTSHFFTASTENANLSEEERIRFIRERFPGIIEQAEQLVQEIKARLTYLY